MRPLTALAPTATTEPSLLGSAAPAPAPAGASSEGRGCSLESSEVLDDKSGFLQQMAVPAAEKLESLRIAVSGTDTNVTWDRVAGPEFSDTYRAPVLARKEGAKPFVIREMPSMGTACSTYGYGAPLAEAGAFVTWGVANSRGLDLWDDIPQVDNFQTSPPKKFIETKGQYLNELVASGGFALVHSTFISWDPCLQQDSDPNQGEPKRTPWLGVYKLSEPNAPPKKITTPKKGDVVPALAMGSEGGLAAYREGSQLQLVWLDSAGAMVSAPRMIAQGEVGAPAVALHGQRALIAWAQRPSKDAPYTLRWAVMPLRSAAPLQTRAGATETPGFAPGVLLGAEQALITWTEGKGTSQGAVFAASFRPETNETLVPIRISAVAEPNARDSEVAGPIEAPTLVYASFTNARPGGVAKLAKLRCR
jgi:hypothetical protein